MVDDPYLEVGRGEEPAEQGHQTVHVATDLQSSVTNAVGAREGPLRQLGRIVITDTNDRVGAEMITDLHRHFLTGHGKGHGVGQGSGRVGQLKDDADLNGAVVKGGRSRIL